MQKKLGNTCLKKLVNTCGLNSKYEFSETWFDDSIDNNLWILDSDQFVSFRCDSSSRKRKNKRRGLHVTHS